MSIKQRLDPTPAEVAGLIQHCQHARFVFNIGLEQRAQWRRSKHDRPEHPERGRLSIPRITVQSQMNELARLRQQLDWLGAGSSSVQQAALRDLDRAFVNFYTGRASYPRFKRRDDRAGGFVVRDLRVRRLNRRWAKVTIPKVGPVRFRLSRPWDKITAATSARVSLRHNRWHISFTTAPAPKQVASSHASVGIDRGVANTLATSEGQMLQMPGLSQGERVRFLALERRLARQTLAAKAQGRQLEDCANRNRTLHEIGTLRSRLDARRTDFIEQTTTELAREYKLIGIENLSTASMVRRPTPRPDPHRPEEWLPNGARAKATLNRLILASRWAEFANRLHNKTEAVTVVAAAYSSQECHACGYIDRANRESQAVFACIRCAHTNHADTNAAEVIRDRALALTKVADPQAHAPVLNPRTTGARPHQSRTPPGRGNPTGRSDAT